MSESMVERVARALSKNDNPRLEWLDRPEHSRAVYLHLARAAIEAMRWPTDAMKTAGSVRGHWADHALGDEWDEADNVWQAMIDAALNEQVAG